MDSVKSDKRQKLNERMIERYSSRYRMMGYDVRTLGWGSVEQQIYRFSQTLQSNVDFTNKRIVDIGCGFGDYAAFLLSNRIEFESYLGVDINPDLIKEAETRYLDHSNIDFKVFNLNESKTLFTPLGDIGVMLGVLNLNLGEEVDNYAYSKEMIDNAYKIIKETLIVDFISTERDKNYPAEDFIFYHDPLEMFKYALTISNNITLQHDYLPIPQKEFMIVIHRQ